MTRDGEFLGVDSLGDRQGKVVPFGKTMLLMRRNRIMDLRLDTIVSEKLLQIIAPLAEDGEDMVYGIARLKRNTNRILVAIDP